MRHLLPAIVLAFLFCSEPVPAVEKGSVEKNHVILTNLDGKDPYHGAVKAFEKIHPEAKVLKFTGRDVAGITDDLRAADPKFVTVVLKPDDLDFNFQASMLKLCTSLDADPFCDFSFGYITGGTAEEAVGFVKNIARAAKKARPQKMLQSPVSIMMRRMEGSALQSFGRPWPMTTLYYGGPRGTEKSPEEIRGWFAKHKADYEGNGVIYMGGHGSPEGIHGGISGEDIRAVKPNLFPAVVYNYACLTACVSRAYQWVKSSAEYRQPVKANEVERGKSMALAILASGASAYIASLEPRPAGMGMFAELKQAMCSGGTLGEVRRREYDMLALGFMTWGEKGLALRHYKAGDPRTLGSSAVRHIMMRDAGGAILFGDPSARICPRKCDLFAVKIFEEGGTLKLECRLPEMDYASTGDVYRSWKGGRSMASRFFAEAELPAGREVKSLSVESVTGLNGQPLEHADLTWAISRTGSVSRIFVKVCVPPRSNIHAGSKAVFILDPEEGGTPAGVPGPESGGGRPPGERKTGSSLERILKTPFAFPKQEMALGSFLTWAQAVLKGKAAGGGESALTFEFDDAVKECRTKTVTVEAMNDPLRKILDGACAQLGIVYVLDGKDGTVRFTTKEKAKGAAEKDPPGAPPGTGRAGGGAPGTPGRPWRSGPVAQTAQSAEALRRWVSEFETIPATAPITSRYAIL
ncbi:MAG: hypothetical protein ACYTFG_08650, partial [Planctomycetota bacterium]